MLPFAGSSPSHRHRAPRHGRAAAIALLCCAAIVLAALNTPAITAQATNLALNRPVSVSSSENATAFPPAAVVDGSTSTRWSSAFSDPQWIQVDLGATRSISRVVLRWEAAYGKAYQIQVSNDGNTWSNAYSTTSGDGGFDEIDLNVSARYVRMNGTERATTYGYSLWEFGIYKP